MLGGYTKEQLGHATQQQTDAYQAEAQKQIARLRRLANGEEIDEPMYELLTAPVGDRLRWNKMLIESCEAEQSSVRDDLLQFLSTGNMRIPLTS